MMCFQAQLVLFAAMPPSNVLPVHGNEKTMNLNSLVLANIQASPYFKVQLYELKTYHQVIDEIYTRVSGHLYCRAFGNAYILLLV